MHSKLQEWRRMKLFLLKSLMTYLPLHTLVFTLLNFSVIFTMLIPSLLNILPSLDFLISFFRFLPSSRGHLNLLCILLFLFYLNVGVSKDFLQDKTFLSTLVLASACHLKVKGSIAFSGALYPYNQYTGITIWKSHEHLNFSVPKCDPCQTLFLLVLYLIE